MDISAKVYPILSKKTIAPGIFDVWVAYPDAAKAKPGQFVNIRCEGFTLRRPISICELDAQVGRMRLVFEVRGAGTQWLAKREPGDTLDLLAPLGNGFSLSPAGKRVVFVGGGIGMPPLLGAAKIFGGNADVILGFRSATAAILKGDFEANGNRVTLVTEDGTAGERGLVTAPLARRLIAEPCDAVYACGPKPMLRAVAQEAEKHGVSCYVSMEERMGCGVGACLSCACKVNVDGREQYAHVCKNGPVFDAKKIVW